MSSYKFDLKEEPATVLIEALPHKYFTINDGSGDFVCSLTRQVVLDDQGRRVRKFVAGPKGQVLVPPRIAEELTAVQGPVDRAGGVAPMARIIKTGVDGEADEDEPKPRRRRRAVTR